MLIIPAIDLQNGACVRLLRGDFDDATQYGDPFAQLRQFEEAGAEWVHIVDLDGARARAPVQHELIGRLAAETRCKIQCGGGVRERTHVEALLEAGVSRVVVGSVSVQRPDDVRAWIASFGAERICVALDVRASGADWDVAVSGWEASGGRSLDEALDAFPPGTLEHALVTDISRDGALSGANAELMRSLGARRPDVQFQASGGVATLADLSELRAIGASAVIVGRALYEKRFTLEDALAL